MLDTISNRLHNGRHMTKEISISQAAAVMGRKGGASRSKRKLEAIARTSRETAEMRGPKISATKRRQAQEKKQD